MIEVDIPQIMIDKSNQQNYVDENYCFYLFCGCIVLFVPAIQDINKPQLLNQRIRERKYNFQFDFPFLTKNIKILIQKGSSAILKLMPRKNIKNTLSNRRLTRQEILQSH